MVWAGSILVDGFGVFFNLVFMLAAALAVILSARYMESEGEQRGEYYALILFAQAGMSIMATGQDLVVLFVALETMALSFYVMVGFLRDSKRSNEAAMKYLILGAFSSGALGVWVFCALRHLWLDQPSCDRRGHCGPCCP